MPARVLIEDRLRLRCHASTSAVLALDLPDPQNGRHPCRGPDDRWLRTLTHRNGPNAADQPSQKSAPQKGLTGNHPLLASRREFVIGAQEGDLRQRNRGR